MWVPKAQSEILFGEIIQINTITAFPDFTLIHNEIPDFSLIFTKKVDFPWFDNGTLKFPDFSWRWSRL